MEIQTQTSVQSALSLSSDSLVFVTRRKGDSRERQAPVPVPSLSRSSTVETENTTSTTLLTPRITSGNNITAGGDIFSNAFGQWTDSKWQPPRRVAESWSSFSSLWMKESHPSDSSSQNSDPQAEVAIHTSGERAITDGVSLEIQPNVEAKTPASRSSSWFTLSNSIQTAKSRFCIITYKGRARVANRVARHRSEWKYKRDRRLIYRIEREKRASAASEGTKTAKERVRRDKEDQVRKRKKKWELLAWFLNYPEIADFYLDESPNAPPRALGLPRLGNFFDMPVTPHPFEQLGGRKR